MTAAHGRDSRIDLVRGISILLVLLLHFSLTYPLVQSPFAAPFGPEAVRAVVTKGNFGVTMFFVVSGFLITSTSMARFASLARISPRRFYAFRAARILPCLVLMLAIVLALGRFGLPSFQNHPPVSTALTALSVLTFWHNLLMQQVGYFNYALNITWSLSVEEVFYLVFPLACLALRREMLLCGFWAIFIVIGPIYRLAHQGNEIPLLYNYLACFDAIAFGCIAAVIAARVSLPPVSRRLCRLVGATIAAATCVSMSVHSVFGATLIGFGIALFLLGGTGAPPGRWDGGRVARAIRWFGRLSYELYLFHIIVLGLMRTVLPRGTVADGWKPLWLAVFLTLSALVAWTVSRFFSDPANRRLRRLLKTASRSGTAEIADQRLARGA